MIHIDLPVPVFVKGMLVGVTIVAPVGPVNVLCVRRTLLDGLIAGLASGLGASIADTLYGAIAAFGVGIVSGLLAHDVALRLLGGTVLVGFGIYTFLTSPKKNQRELTAGTSLVRDFGGALLLTLTNPTTVFSFLAVYSAFGLAASQETWEQSLLLIGGVFSGALLWWGGVIGVINHFRERFDESNLRSINRVSGLVIIAFGILAFLSLATAP